MLDRKFKTSVKDLNEAYNEIERSVVYLYEELDRNKASLDNSQYAKYRFTLDDIALAALDVKKTRENLEREHKTVRSSVRGLLNRITKK